MQLIEMEIKDLKTTEYNPRVEFEIDSPEFRKLENVIEKFDMVEPVVWNKRTGNVVGGAQRISVLKHLGKKKTLVSVVDMDLQEEKLLNVALNKIKGGWDFDKLKKLFNGIDYSDFTLTGFSVDEIALMLEDDEEYFNVKIADEEVFGKPKIHGESWVIVLKFDSIDEAKKFVEKENMSITLKENTSTAVYRIED